MPILGDKFKKRLKQKRLLATWYYKNCDFEVKRKKKALVQDEVILCN